MMKTGGSRKCWEYGGHCGRREMFHNLDEEDDVTDEEEISAPGSR